MVALALLSLDDIKIYFLLKLSLFGKNESCK